MKNKTGQEQDKFPYDYCIITFVFVVLGYFYINGGGFSVSAENVIAICAVIIALA